MSLSICSVHKNRNIGVCTKRQYNYSVFTRQEVILRARHSTHTRSAEAGRTWEFKEPSFPKTENVCRSRHAISSISSFHEEWMEEACMNCAQRTQVYILRLSEERTLRTETSVLEWNLLRGCQGNPAPSCRHQAGFRAKSEPMAECVW